MGSGAGVVVDIAVEIWTKVVVGGGGTGLDDELKVVEVGACTQSVLPNRRVSVKTYSQAGKASSDQSLHRSGGLVIPWPSPVWMAHTSPSLLGCEGAQRQSLTSAVHCFLPSRVNSFPCDPSARPA